MTNEKRTRRLIWFSISVIALLLFYFFVTRRIIPAGYTSKIELIALILLLFLLVIKIITLFINLLRLLLFKDRKNQKLNFRGHMYTLITILGLLIILVVASQWSAHTSKFTDENGKTLPQSISSMEKVKLGGVDQWLIIRSENVNKPVLLFLSGGPGASEAARVIRFNAELEKHFVVVIWEQRGCGKSYPSFNPKTALTVDQYVSDVIELTELLRERFEEEKIYLVGHSWGTIIGVRAAQERPDLFHAYIGTSQMVDVAETDQMIYDLVMEHSQQSGDLKFVETLAAQGKPPYFGKNPVKPYSALFGKEYSLFEYPNIRSEEYRRDGDILMLMLKQPEYGWLDRVYYLLGLMNTFNAVYPQLQEMDLRLDATHLDLPVYMILGRHDLNNPSQLPEEYFNLLEAPSKRLFYFENSGHGMIWEEPDLFTDILVNSVIPETYPL